METLSALRSGPLWGIPFSKHDNVIKWKHFPRYWHLCGEFTGHRWIPRSQWRGALMFSLICVWINGWVNNREAGDLRRHRAHYGVIVIEMERYSRWLICGPWLRMGWSLWLSGVVIMTISHVLPQSTWLTFPFITEEEGYFFSVPLLSLNR